MGVSLLVVVAVSIVLIVPFLAVYDYAHALLYHLDTKSDNNRHNKLDDN